uniref:THAP-type domain-containing protein n=1 Tax=Neogobius melanostomus TaxID=47308 RepID=A0A8C6SSF6_9GOBI
MTLLANGIKEEEVLFRKQTNMAGCCVRGCSSGEKLRSSGLRFFPFPVWRRSFGPQVEDLSRRRRLAWVSAVRLRDVTFEHVPEQRQVCSLHFRSGEPSNEMMETDPDWAPSLRLSPSEVAPANPTRFEWRIVRERRLELEAQREAAPETRGRPNSESKQLLPPTPTEAPPLSPVQDVTMTTVDEQPPRDRTDCDMCVLRRDEINRLLEENRRLKQQLAAAKFTEGFLASGGDDKVRYYTGLPDYTAFTELLTGLQPLMAARALKPFQMLLLTLMRLRLDLPVVLLANLVLVSPGTVYRVFRETVSSLHTLTTHAIAWPERDADTVTQPFRDAFGDKAVVIVDVFEIVTEKNKHTVKYLVAVTPKGATCFLSRGFGGSSRDKELLLESGLLERLRPGDVVLAYKGFDINPGVGMLCAEVRHSGNGDGPKIVHRHAKKVEKISHLRSDVKKAVGSWRQKYKLLSGAVSVTMTAAQEGEELTLLDKIVTVCCALTNIYRTSVGEERVKRTSTSATEDLASTETSEQKQD